MRISLLCVVLCFVAVATAAPRCITLAPGATRHIKLVGSPTVAPEFFYEWQVFSVAPELKVEHKTEPSDVIGAPIKHVFAVTTKTDVKPGSYDLVFKTVGGKQAKMKEAKYTIKVKALKTPKVTKSPKTKAPKAPRVKKPVVRKSTQAPVVAPVQAPVMIPSVPAAVKPVA